MTNVDQARASQFRNIEAKTGQSLEGLCAEIGGSGKVKHGEIRTWLMEHFGLGYGDANALAHAAKTEPASPRTRKIHSRRFIPERKSTFEAFMMR